jgi:hypothetical protein
VLVDKCQTFGTTHLASRPEPLQRPANCEHQTAMDRLMSTIRYISQVQRWGVGQVLRLGTQTQHCLGQYDVFNALHLVTAAHAASSDESFGPGWCRHRPLASAQTRCDCTPQQQLDNWLGRIKMQQAWLLCAHQAIGSIFNLRALQLGAPSMQQSQKAADKAALRCGAVACLGCMFCGCSTTSDMASPDTRPIARYQRAQCEVALRCDAVCRDSCRGRPASCQEPSM